MGLMVKELVKASVMSVKKELRWGFRQHRKSTTNNNYSCSNHRNAIAAHHHHHHLVEVLAGHGQQDGSVTSHTAQDGTVKMTILIKKQDLDRILLEAMNNNTTHDMLAEAEAQAEAEAVPDSISSSSSSSSSSSFSMESPLYDLLRIMRRRRARNNPSSSTWRPALHTIPE